MWQSNLITAWRSMVRNRMFTFINVTGLALAVTACLLIGLYLQYEWSYDKQSPNANHIWRAYNETISNGKVVTQDANTHAILGPSLKADLPEVVDYTRLYNRNQKEVYVIYDNQPYKINSAWMTDPSFLRMFPQQFISGDPASCLTAPYSLVVTASTAEKLFGKKDPIGQTIQVPGGWMAGNYNITAVVADPPPNTHLKFNLLASYSTRDAQGIVPAWDSYWDYNYFQLSPNADVRKVKNQLAVYSEKHLKQEGITLNMQPLTGIHLNSKLTYEIEDNSDASTIRALAFIALFILFIAFINYINLTTSRSLMRAKEVSVRKVLGADRQQLIKQFLTEGGLVSAIAISSALLLLWITLPLFEDFLGKPLINYAGFQQNFWLLIPALWLLAIISACLYPAFALSSFSPIKTLRNNLSLSGKNNLRRALVVFQFACSTILIIGIFVIVQQLHYMRNHDVDEDFIKTLELKIIAGNDYNLSDVQQLDTSDGGRNMQSSYMLNESAVKALGWTPEEAVGKTIIKNREGLVKAVVKDFHFRSLHEPIKPLLIFLDKQLVNNLFVKLSGENISATLNQLEATWKQRITHRPFEYHFLDEDYNALYKTEQRTAGVFTTFSTLAILLACLGLFALTAYAVVQRTKEIGIRKVLGATVLNILGLISKDFLKLVIIAMIIAIPVSLYAVNKWLEGFTYKIIIQWWVFVLAGLVTLIIAFATTSLQAIKTALTNPVKNLRTE